MPGGGYISAFFLALGLEGIVLWRVYAHASQGIAAALKPLQDLGATSMLLSRLRPSVAGLEPVVDLAEAAGMHHAWYLRCALRAYRNSADDGAVSWRARSAMMLQQLWTSARAHGGADRVLDSVCGILQAQLVKYVSRIDRRIVQPRFAQLDALVLVAENLDLPCARPVRAVFERLRVLQRSAMRASEGVATALRATGAPRAARLRRAVVQFATACSALRSGAQHDVEGEGIKVDQVAAQLLDRLLPQYAAGALALTDLRESVRAELRADAGAVDTLLSCMAPTLTEGPLRDALASLQDAAGVAHDSWSGLQDGVREILLPVTQEATALATNAALQLRELAGKTLHELTGSGEAGTGSQPAESWRTCLTLLRGTDWSRLGMFDRLLEALDSGDADPLATGADREQLTALRRVRTVIQQLVPARASLALPPSDGEGDSARPSSLTGPPSLSPVSGPARPPPPRAETLARAVARTTSQPANVPPALGFQWSLSPPAADTETFSSLPVHTALTPASLARSAGLSDRLDRDARTASRVSMTSETDSIYLDVEDHPGSAI